VLAAASRCWQAQAASEDPDTSRRNHQSTADSSVVIQEIDLSPARQPTHSRAALHRPSQQHLRRCLSNSRGNSRND